MEHTESVDDVEGLTYTAVAALHGGPGQLGGSCGSGFAARHTVIIEVLEGLDFVGGGDRRYYVKLGLVNSTWSTTPSAKSRNPIWREYFIGEFVGTKLESPSLVIRVKFRGRGRARTHLFGTCKIPLLSVSGNESQDRWYDLCQNKLTAGQPKMRLRLTCRKAYDKKSEVEVEVAVINSIIGQERESITHNTERIAELTATSPRGGSGGTRIRHKVQKLLREIARANKRVRGLQAKKQDLLDKAKHRHILLSQSEANFCIPSLQQQQQQEKEEGHTRAELHERLQTVRAKLRRETDAFEFHKRYSGEVESDDKDDWIQNTDELRRRLVYLKNREKTYLALLQEVISRESSAKSFLPSGSSQDNGEIDTYNGGDDGSVAAAAAAAIDKMTEVPMDKMKVLRIRKGSIDTVPILALMERGDNDGEVGGSLASEDNRRSGGEGAPPSADGNPFPGVPFHAEWESFSALKGAKYLAHHHHGGNDDDDDEGGGSFL